MQANVKPTSSAKAIPNWVELVRRRVENLREGRIALKVEDRQVTEIECEEKTNVFAAFSLAVCAEDGCDQSSSDQLVKS
jgi:hypothetical protein